MNSSDGMRIAVDVDGTVADTHRAFVSFYNDKEDENYSVSDITDWELTTLDITMERFIGGIREVWDKYHDTITIDESAPHVIETLSRTDTVDVVTSNVASKSDIRLWLRKNGVKAYDDFTAKHDKHLMGHDLYIDDNPNLVDHVENQILIDRPWNRCVDTSEHDGVHRACNLAEALLKVNKYP